MHHVKKVVIAELATLLMKNGAIMANAALIPIGNKLEVRSNEEILLKLIMIEGTLSIQAGDNPRIVRDKLIAYLEPSQREEITQEVGD